MAKNRFNTRASWDTNFRYSGQLGPSSPSSNIRTPRVSKIVNIAKKDYFHKMNDWEKGFISNLDSTNFTLSDKQLNKVKDIIKKYDTGRRVKH